jgi:flagellar motor switch protein FliN/FliY
MADDFERELEEIAAAAEEVAQNSEPSAWGGGSTLAGGAGQGSQTIDFLLDVTLLVTVEVGRARMTIQDLLQLGQGSVMELEKLAGEPLDIFINGRQVARGEAVIVNEKFGVRLTDIISPEERTASLS